MRQNYGKFRVIKNNDLTFAFISEIKVLYIRIIVFMIKSTLKSASAYFFVGMNVLVMLKDR